MKKILTKLVLFALISLMITAIPQAVYAEDTKEPTDNAALELQKAFDGLGPEEFCIQEVGEESPDSKYIVTIVEEPLTLENSEEKTPDADFEARICFRNYLSYRANDEEQTIATLAKKCSNFITSGKYQDSKFEKYKIKASCKAVQVYLSRGGTALIEGYISTIYKWAASLVGIIAVLVIVISAIQISVAGGDTQAITDAKDRIIKSIAGIAVLFLSGLILYTINPTFFVR